MKLFHSGISGYQTKSCSLLTVISIFASTASAILIPSLSPTPPSSTGSSTPNANSRSADTPGATVAPTVRKLSLLAAAKKETARRGLYSRFSRGTTLSKEPTPVPETEVQFTVASTSSEPQVAASIASSSNSTDKKGKGKAVSETKGEKRARRAAKQARKEVKARRREDKAARQAVKSGEANQVFGDGDDSRTGDLRPETSTATEPAGPRQKSKRKRAGEDAGAKPTKHRRAAAELAT